MSSVEIQPTRKQPASASTISWTIYAGGCIVVGLLLLILVQKSNLNFGTYWESGHAATNGLNPYAAYPRTNLTQSPSFLGPVKTNVDLNLNPPIMLPLFAALSHLMGARFVTAWTAGSFLLFASAVGLLLWRFPEMQTRQLLWLFLACPVVDTFLGGQIYFLLFFLSAVACVDRERGWRSAIAIGLLVAIKPTFIFWPIFLFLAGYRKLAVRCFLVVAIASSLPILFYGPAIYLQWYRALAGDLHWTLTSNIAIPVYFARMDHSALGKIVATLLATGTGWWLWKRRPSIETVSGVALCCSILFAPLAWNSYILFIAPWFVMQLWGKLSTAAAVMVTVPTSVAVVYSTRYVSLPVLYFLAVWIMLASFLNRNHYLAIP